MDGWRKGIRFSSAHATLDLGKCERLHGHSYALHARIVGGQDERRIVFDFVEVVKALREIADEIDHFVLVPTKSKRIKVKADETTVTMQNGDRKYSFPRGDCFLLPTPSSTAEDLADFVMGELRRRVKFPKGISRVEVGCDEGYGQGAWASWVPGGAG